MLSATLSAFLWSNIKSTCVPASTLINSEAAFGLWSVFGAADYSDGLIPLSSL